MQHFNTISTEIKEYSGTDLDQIKSLSLQYNFYPLVQ